MKRFFEKKAAFVAAVFKKSKGLVLWNVFNWFFDKPIWAFVEAYAGIAGVPFLMLFAIFCINLPGLVWLREEIDTTLLDEAIDEVKNSRGIFFLRLSLKGGFFFGIILFENFFSGCVIFLIALAVGGIFQIIFLGLKILLSLEIIWLENLIMFFALSFLQDSCIATIYFRHGRKGKLGARDYTIFLASSVVSVSYWAVRMGLIVEFARILLK